MTESFMKNQEQDENRMINIKESRDLNYWCEELNLQARELLEIVKEVGPLPHDVRLYLAKKHLTQWPAAY